MKIVHFADLHLGAASVLTARDPGTHLRPLEQDALAAVDAICAYVQDHSIDAVLFAGDAFERHNPSQSLVQQLTDRIAAIRDAGASFIGVVGNHDLPQSLAVGHAFGVHRALKPERIYFSDECELVVVETNSGPLQVATLSHFSISEVRAKLTDEPIEEIERIINASVADRLNEIRAQLDTSVPAVFLGHCHVPNASTIVQPRALSELTVNLSTLTSGSGFAYYALGHIHDYQVVSSSPLVVYPGAPLRLDFGEGHKFQFKDSKLKPNLASTKGFSRVDLIGTDATHEFVEIPSRDFLTINVKAAESDDPTGVTLEAIEAVRASFDLAGTCVKVNVTVRYTPELQVSVIKSHLTDTAFATVRVEQSSQSEPVRDPRFEDGRSDLDYFMSYVEDSEGISKKDEFVAAGAEIISTT